MQGVSFARGATSSRGATQQDGAHTLDGARLTPLTFALICGGALGNLLFVAVYSIEGITRPGYVAWLQPISALSLGSGGWLQQVNFIVFGVLAILAAVGWRQALAPGRASVWYPLLRGVEGLGLIVDGVFSEDPTTGYPHGAVAPTIASAHGTIHSLVAVVAFLSLAISNFVLARRFWREARWRAWAPFAVGVGVATIVLFVVFGSTIAHPGLPMGPGGLYERLSTGVDLVFGWLVVLRLFTDRRRAANG